MEVNESEKPDEGFSRCHGGARKGAGRPKKALLESGKITRLRLFEDTARKWKTLQLAANFSTHEDFASYLLDKYEADINQSDNATHQLQVTSSMLLDNLSKLEAQSNIGSKKRKPQRTIHIDPHGSASLIKTTKDVHPVPKQLLQCSQRVKESIANLDKELKCFSEDVSSSSHTKQPTSLSHYNVFGESGMLSIRTCKSTEDRLPPIDGTLEVHTVDVFCPKTPQKLYFTPIENPVAIDSDDSTSASTSSSDGFLPNTSTTTGNTRSSSRNKPVTVVSVPDPADQDSTDNEVVTVVILPDINNQSEPFENMKDENEPLQDMNDQSKPLQSIEIPKVTDTLLNEPSNASSRSCSPLTIKDSNQQKPLNNFSLKVVKLPQSMLGSNNLSTGLQSSSAEAKDANEEKRESSSQVLFQVSHAEAATAHHSANPQRDTTTNDSGTEIDLAINANTVLSTRDVEIDPQEMQDSASVTTIDDWNASPSDSVSPTVVPVHANSAEVHYKPTSPNSHKIDSSKLKDSGSKINSASTSVSSQDTKKTKYKEVKSQKFVVSSSSEQEDTVTNAKTQNSVSGNSAVSHQKAVKTKLGDHEEVRDAISSKQVEDQTQESETLHRSPSSKKIPVDDDDDGNHSSPLLKRKLFSSDKDNQSTGVNNKSSSKPKFRSKGKSRSDKIPCLSCKGSINLSSQAFYKHPRFSAYMCKKCYQLYTRGSFTVDNVDGHEEYCCVCGEGGDIVCCDFCNYSVCQECIQRIAGKEYLTKVLESDEDWKCFDCDTTLLHIYEQHYSLHDAGNRLVDASQSHEDKLQADDEVDDKECDSPVLLSLSSCNVSGIDTDEVSMSDTELCNNINENNSEENSSSSSRSSNANNSKMASTASRKRRRGLVDRLLDSDNSDDEVSKRAKYSLSETNDEDFDVEIVEPVSHDPENLSDSLRYTLAQTSSGSEEHSDSDSEPIDMKARASGKVHLLSDDDSQQLLPDHLSNQKLKQYSTRSKAYKGSELESASKAKRKIRKRNKVLSSDSDSNTSVEDAVPSTPGKKRRKLRKLIDDDKLAKQTKQAQKDEQLRLQRIKEISQQNTGNEDNHFILEKSEDVTIDVNPKIACHLKPHQQEGVKFLWNCCCENLEQLTTSPGSGAILAHCMGLGKTLQVIAFIEALLRNESCTNIFRVAIIVPVNTLENWKNELEKWIPEDDRPRIYLPAFCNSLSTRLCELEDWFEMGGILVCGYEMYRNLASGKGKGFKNKRSRSTAVSKYLLDPGPDIVVCDEGHVLKNPKSLLSQELTKLRTLRRIVLTGTPLQNNLMEYYTMVSFVKPSLLGTQKEFSNRFVNPIKNGQCRNSNAQDVRLMKYRSHVLHKLLEGCVQRHDYSVLTKDLPAKQEYVVLLRLSDVQESLYKLYLDRHVDHANLGIGGTLLVAYQMLFKIWNHPWVLRLRDLQKREEEEIEDDANDLRDFIVSGSEGEDGNTRRSPENKDDPDLIILSDSEPVEKPNKVASNTVTGNQYVGDAGRMWYGNIFTDDMETMLELSGKLVFLFQLLEETQRLDEKVLVFSQSLLTLDLIESFLQMREYGDWCRGLDYLRIDGSTSANCRSYCVNTFNSEENSKTRLFLISTKAGSLGVNLTAANRVVIFDASWNPTNDLQAIFRTYRYGQIKPVFIYRLLSKGTMEEKIYERQVTKESLSLRVVDEKQISRHYNLAELNELFEYSPAEKRDTPDPSLSDPKEDLVLRNLLKSLHPKWISEYHEHDSLLEHRFAEELTEEERKKAWENYEAKKTESVQYAERAALISQLVQQQNAFAGAGPSVSHLSNGQPAVMPYTNQPHPPGSVVQGIKQVELLAIQNVQIINGLKSEVDRINFDLARPGVHGTSHAQNLLQLKAQRVDKVHRTCESMKFQLRVISTALQSPAVPSQYQAELDPLFRHLTKTVQTFQNWNL